MIFKNGGSRQFYGNIADSHEVGGVSFIEFETKQKIHIVRSLLSELTIINVEEERRA